MKKDLVCFVFLIQKISKHSLFSFLLFFQLKTGKRCQEGSCRHRRCLEECRKGSRTSNLENWKIQGWLSIFIYLLLFFWCFCLFWKIGHCLARESSWPIFRWWFLHRFTYLQEKESKKETKWTNLCRLSIKFKQANNQILILFFFFLSARTSTRRDRCLGLGRFLLVGK